VEILQGGAIPGAPRIGSSEAFIRDAQKLVDEFQLIEFTDTEVEPK
jgi:hypothetical protein